MKVLEDGTVTMTFDEYDSHVKDAQECGYQLSATWYPSMETAMRIMEDFPHNVLFAIWLLESNPSVILSPKQKEVNKYLRRGMREMLVLEE